MDIDASCILLNTEELTQQIVFYGTECSADGAVKHSGDNLTGNGEGDDEQIEINVISLPNLTILAGEIKPTMECFGFYSHDIHHRQDLPKRKKCLREAC